MAREPTIATLAASGKTNHGKPAPVIAHVTIRNRLTDACHVADTMNRHQRPGGAKVWTACGKRKIPQPRSGKRNHGKPAPVNAQITIRTAFSVAHWTACATNTFARRRLRRPTASKATA